MPSGHSSKAPAWVAPSTNWHTVAVSVWQPGWHKCALSEVCPEALMAGRQRILTAVQGEGELHSMKNCPAGAGRA